jgi:peptide/nickel transport system substrate-binding protein
MNNRIIRSLVTLFSLMIFSLSLVSAQQDSIVIAQGTDAASLDPQRQNDAFTTSILSNIFDTLIYRDADLNLVPGLATGWTLIDDTTWEVTLREGITFHNGESFDAEDVKFTLERPLNPDLGSPLASRFNVIAGVDVIDPLTVHIRTNSPYPLLPARLSEWFIMPKEYSEATDLDTLAEQPVGTGAYTFVSWTRDDRLTLAANSDYWRGAPSIETVVFRPIPELSTRVAALQSGEVQIAVNIPAFQAAELDADSNLDVRGVPSTFFQYVALDGTKNEVLADVRVRQAIQYATNVPEIVEFLFDGNALQIAVPLAFGTFGLDETIEPYPYDPDRARELLAEAGYPDGITFAMDAPTGRYAQDREVAEALVGQWAQVGINVELNINAWADQLAKYRDGAALVESHFMGWGTSTFDADDVLWGAFANRPNKNNYENDRITELVNEARTIFDPDQRAELYREAQQIIYEEVPWLFLFQQVDLYGVSSELDWQPRPDQKIEVWTISAQ